MQEESKTFDTGIVEIYAHVQGNVQGVGFRATVRHYAKLLGLVGTVQNLADGSVEIKVQGSSENIEKLFQSLHKEFGSKHIKNIEQQQNSTYQTYRDFVIIH